MKLQAISKTKRRQTATSFEGPVDEVRGENLHESYFGKPEERKLTVEKTTRSEQVTPSVPVSSSIQPSTSELSFDAENL